MKAATRRAGRAEGVGSTVQVGRATDEAHVGGPSAQSAMVMPPGTDPGSAARTLIATAKI